MVKSNQALHSHSSGLTSAVLVCHSFQFPQLAGSWASPRHSLRSITDSNETTYTIQMLRKICQKICSFLQRKRTNIAGRLLKQHWRDRLPAENVPVAAVDCVWEVCGLVEARRVAECGRQRVVRVRQPDGSTTPRKRAPFYVWVTLYKLLQRNKEGANYFKNGKWTQKSCTSHYNKNKRSEVWLNLLWYQTASIVSTCLARQAFL